MHTKQVIWKKYGNIRLEKEKDTKGNKKSSMDKKPQNLSTFIKYRVGAHWSEYLNQGIVCILH